MKIHQFVHTLSYGDAISGEALAIRNMLLRESIESQLYAVNAHEKVKTFYRDWRHFTADLEQAEAAGEDTAVILHYSIGSPLNDVFKNEQRIKRALIYHNLTPEHWYFGYNKRVVDDLRQGREELPKLLESVDVVLADSPFNLKELHELGCTDGRVLPLLMDSEKWNVPANAGIARAVRGNGCKNFLHVGRFAPNKCVQDIIKAFYFYHFKINLKSHLWLIGSDIDTEIYSFELRKLAAELGLKDDVTFVGTVADSELRAFYESADAYLCMSEHEGFCVPVIEAMHFGVPVIAYRSSAVGGTLGNSGLLLNRKAPAETAELMDIVTTDRQFRESLITGGKQRAEDFSTAAFLRELRANVIGPLQAVTRLDPKAAARS